MLQFPVSRFGVSQVSGCCPFQGVLAHGKSLSKLSSSPRHLGASTARLGRSIVVPRGHYVVAPSWKSKERVATGTLRSQWAHRSYASNEGEKGQRKSTSRPTPSTSAERSPAPAQTPIETKIKELKQLTRHENIYNIPNILTASRLIAAPVCGYLILHQQNAWAVALFAYAGITDLIDGWVARKYNLQTVVGSVIDPMADKALMTILVASLAATGSLPLPLAIIILGRDVSLAIAAIYYRFASLPHPKTFARYWDFSLPSAEVHPTTISKYNTFLQLLLIGWTLVLPVLPPPPEVFSPVLAPLASSLHTLGMQVTDTGSWEPFTRSFQLVVASTTLWSGFSYAFLKNAVTILGKDQALKQRQGRRGRAIIGVSYFAFVAVAGWLWVTRDKETRKDQDTSDGEV